MFEDSLRRIVAQNEAKDREAGRNHCHTNLHHSPEHKYANNRYGDLVSKCNCYI